MLIPLDQQAAGTLGEEWGPGVIFNPCSHTKWVPRSRNLVLLINVLG